MSARAQTVRLTLAQQRTLTSFAKTYGLSDYAMLSRIVDDGLVALVEQTGNATASSELVSEIAAMSTRLAHVEQMIDRALFTACAAYCYARSGAMAARKSEDVIAAEINAAYDRQRRLARDGQA